MYLEKSASFSYSSAREVHDRALSQINFLNGETMYSDAHTQALMSWLREDAKHLEQKQYFFCTMKRIRKECSSMQYERSPLSTLFEEVFCH